MDIISYAKVSALANQVNIPTKYVFADDDARDAYFAAHSAELVEGLLIAVGTGFQKYIESSWEAFTGVIGIKGEDAINDLAGYTTVSAVSDTYTLDLKNKPIKNFRIETEDADAKTVALDNVPSGDSEIFIELTYTNTAAITWFEGITWLSGFAPTFTEGKVYRIALFKYGTGWHGNSVGGW